MQTLDIILILVALGCWLAASLVALARACDERLHLGLGLAGALVSLVPAVHVLIGGAPSGLEFTFWNAPARLEVDALSAAFLVPLNLVAGLGLVYGTAYWPSSKPTARSVRAFFCLLTASLILVFTARQGVLFLMAWEVMALSAFLLIGTEHGTPQVQRASWIYLMCTHTGTLLLIAAVALLAHRTGSLLWVLPVGLPDSSLDGGIMLLALLGFGFKAGFLPLHFWLPEAHAWAPSHVSAILSGIMLKAGIYGLLRFSTQVPSTPPFLGGLVLTLGALTALFGVLHALAQSDYKRLLAYSSIENIGIVSIGLGLGWTGRAYHEPWLTALGFAGALFHVWNHALFKGLLFFGAGSLLHATGTRQIEALGGLAKRMPRTALLLFPGVLAVAALPPFNAFISEWFLYRALLASFQRGESWAACLALPALALTGGLAAVAFTKFYGFVFLGEPRSPLGAHAHDPGPAMLAPMAILATLCLALGLASLTLLPVLDRVVSLLAPEASGLLVPGLGRDLTALSAMLALVVLLGLACGLWLLRSQRQGLGASRPPTWDCGYARPSLRMQYTASSYSDGWASIIPGFKERVRRLKLVFPKPVSYRSELLDPVGERYVEPRFERLAERLLRYRQLQHGHLSLYILYILLALLGVFLWMLLRSRLLG
jgi:hydrogenase-4 component B